MARFRQMVGPLWFIPNASVGHRVRDEQLSWKWLTERAFILGRSLVAQKLPKESCYAPTWEIAWHPTLWTMFDRSLVTNFLLGQLYEAERVGRQAKHVVSEIGRLLLDLLAPSLTVILSTSARASLASLKSNDLIGLFSGDRAHERLLNDELCVENMSGV